MSDENDNPLINRDENQLLSLLVNIVIPVCILIFLSNEDYLGAKLGFVVALSFPFCYGVYDFLQRRKINFIAALGLINVLLTGGIGLLEIDNHWLAVKEATIPALIGLAVLASVKTKYPLIKTLFYNDIIVDTKNVDQVLEEKNHKPAFDNLIVRSTVILSSSFLLSSILNYVLAKVIVVSDPGTAAYNQELGKMMALSYPVIAIPSTIVMLFAFWYLYRGIKRLTGLNADSILKIG